MRFGKQPRHRGTTFAGVKLNILNETDATERQRWDVRSIGGMVTQTSLSVSSVICTVRDLK